jgi:hypothetical protein
MKKPISSQDLNELEGLRRNALANGGMAGRMYLDKYLAVSSRLAPGQQMPAHLQRTFWHFYQVQRAERAVEARHLGEKRGTLAPVGRKQLNEAESELESILVRAGL